jgi:hypothetical protein
MSKKINKKQIRKLQTHAAIQKKKSKKLGFGYMEGSIADDYYATADHLSYDDLNDLMGTSRFYASIED